MTTIQKTQCITQIPIKLEQLEDIYVQCYQIMLIVIPWKYLWEVILYKIHHHRICLFRTLKNLVSFNKKN